MVIVVHKKLTPAPLVKKGSTIFGASTRLDFKDVPGGSKSLDTEVRWSISGRLHLKCSELCNYQQRLFAISHLQSYLNRLATFLDVNGGTAK